MSSRRYYFRKHGRKFEICDMYTYQHVSNEPLLDTYEQAVWRMNELNGVKQEGFEPVK